MYSALLECMKEAGLYWNQYPSGIPDFDCDDYAWMAMNWLRRTLLDRFPDAECCLRGVCWTCPDGTESCHAVVRIYVGGKIYFYDPMTDTLMGPYDILTITDEQILAILKQLCSQVACPGATDWERRIRPNTPWTPLRPHELEPPPFDTPTTDPDYQGPIPWCRELPPDYSWQRFQEILAACCATLPPLAPRRVPDDCPHPTQVPYPDGTIWWWPDPCDPNAYIRPNP